MAMMRDEMSKMLKSIFRKAVEFLHIKKRHPKWQLEEKPVWTKWHSACKLIAILVGGKDLVVGDRAKLIIKTSGAVGDDDSNFNTFYLASSSSENSACQVAFPAVFSIDDLGKDLAWWSESQAKAVAMVVWLNDHQGDLVYGLGSFVQGNYHLQLEVGAKLPQVNSEEELMMRATIAFGDAGNLEK